MSPIHGLSEKVRLPRLGKIRLGIKVQSDKAKSPYPKAVDYFVCPSEVQKVFGEKPKELRIMFPTEDSEQWASQFYRCYSQTRGLICKGDGENAIALVDTTTGEIATKESKTTELREVSCNSDDCSKLESGACKPVMNLQFLLPEVPGLGIWQLDTSSINSIRNINSAIKLIKGVLGRISLVPLSLKVGPQEVQVEGYKKNIYVLQLASSYNLIQIVNKLEGLPIGKALLPEPDREPPDDLFPEEIIAEPSTKAPPQPAKQASEAESATESEPPSNGGIKDDTAATTPSPIDLAWLQEQLKLLQSKKLKAFTNTNIVSYLNTLTKQKAKSVSEAVSHLNQEQAEQFVREISNAVEMA